MDDAHLGRLVERRVGLAGRGEGQLAYLDLGSAERPVDAVFLHANGFNAWTYRRILAPLADRFRILAVDQRGHGRTTLATPHEGRHDWLDLRDDLLALLDILSIEGAVLAGHSMGGTVSLLAAAARPASCSRLALFDPVIFPPRAGGSQPESPLAQGALRRRARFASRAEAMASYRGRGAFKTWPDDVLADYVQAGFHDLEGGGVALACSPEWEASGFAVEGEDAWAALRSATCPIQILRAAVGSTLTLNDEVTLDSSRIRIATPPGSTHFLPMEQPELVRSVLAAAIEAG